MATLPSLRRAAVLLAELPADDARLLLSRLEPEEVAALAGEFSHVAFAEQNRDEQDGALADFATHLKSRFQEIVPGPIRVASCEELRRILLTEHPQTIATVLAHLPRRHAVEFLGTLPATQQSDLVCRIATAISIDREILGELFSALEYRLIGTTPQQDPAKRCA